MVFSQTKFDYCVDEPEEGELYTKKFNLIKELLKTRKKKRKRVRIIFCTFEVEQTWQKASGHSRPRIRLPRWVSFGFTLAPGLKRGVDCPRPGSDVCKRYYNLEGSILGTVLSG